MKYKLSILAAISALLLLIAVIGACGGDSGETNGPTEEKTPPPTTESPPETVATDSGLQFISIRTGTGMQPQIGDRISFHYLGLLESGTEFDSSAGREPFSYVYGLEPIIPGVAEGIGMMQGGGKAKLIIPPELAYGGTQVGNIPPNSTLHFELDLVGIDRPDPPQEVAEAEYTTTESGLKYYDFTVGNGAAPQTGDTVVMHSAIWREDGTPLGSSYNTGQPQIMPFGSGQMLPGWEEGVSTMYEGGKRQLVVPPELAYGAQGYGQVVPPDTTLIIEIELLKVIPVPEPPEFKEFEESELTPTDSGVKYTDITTGSGPSPRPGQNAVVHYTGWLASGTQFDSSIDRGQPMVFTLGAGQMIPGFEEGVSDMQVGGTRLMVIPPELGYGDTERGSIPANSTLVFEVKLEYVF